ILASRTGEGLVDYGAPGRWPHGEGRLAVNPLYARRPDPSGPQYVRSYPSQYYAEENAALSGYLPESFRLDDGWLEEPAAREDRGVRDLIARCAVLGFPDGYLE